MSEDIPRWYPGQNYPDRTPPRPPGAPAPTPPTTPTPAGWYPDPADPAVRRYWDGTAWTADQDWDNPTPVPPRGNGPGGYPYATFWDRFLGLLLDSLILAVPAFLIIGVILFGFIGELQATDDGVIVSVGVTLTLVLIAIQGAYFVVGIHKFGRTIGGKAVGIRCVDAAGNNPSWGSSLIRWGVVQGFYLAGNIPLIGFLTYPLLLINYLAMLWSPRKQCWMDAAARTYVVKSN